MINFKRFIPQYVNISEISIKPELFFPPSTFLPAQHYRLNPLYQLKDSVIKSLFIFLSLIHIIPIID